VCGGLQISHALASVARLRLGLLRALTPEGKNFGFLALDPLLQSSLNSGNTGMEDSVNDANVLGPSLGWNPVVVKVRSAVEFNAAFMALCGAADHALYVAPSTLTTADRGHLIVLSAMGSSPASTGQAVTWRGISFLTVDLTGKRLDLLRKLLPQATTAAFLAEPRGAAFEEQTTSARAAGLALGWRVMVLEVRSERDFEPAFSTLVERGANAVVVAASPLLTSNRRQIIALAAHHNIPATYQGRQFAIDGGLISYGTSLAELY
jgi:hypothetical protein